MQSDFKHQRTSGIRQCEAVIRLQHLFTGDFILSESSEIYAEHQIYSSHLTERCYLVEKLIGVVVRRSRIGQDHPEEVWNVSQRLVPDQRVAFVHQVTFDLRCNLKSMKRE